MQCNKWDHGKSSDRSAIQTDRSFCTVARDPIHTLPSTHTSASRSLTSDKLCVPLQQQFPFEPAHVQRPRSHLTPEPPHAANSIRCLCPSSVGAERQHCRCSGLAGCPPIRIQGRTVALLTSERIDSLLSHIVHHDREHAVLVARVLEHLPRYLHHLSRIWHLENLRGKRKVALLRHLLLHREQTIHSIHRVLLLLLLRYQCLLRHSQRG